MESLTCTRSAFSDRVIKLAHRVGPKRGITALAVLSAAVGASLVVRRLKARAVERDRAIAEFGGVRTRKQRRLMKKYFAAQAPQSGLEPF